MQGPGPPTFPRRAVRWDLPGRSQVSVPERAVQPRPALAVSAAAVVRTRRWPWRCRRCRRRGGPGRPGGAGGVGEREGPTGSPAPTGGWRWPAAARAQRPGGRLRRYGERTSAGQSASAARRVVPLPSVSFSGAGRGGGAEDAGVADAAGGVRS